MSTTPDPSNTEPKEERPPFFSEIEKKIFGWYTYTAIMVVCMIGGIFGAVLSLTITSSSVPTTGGLTLLWRIPLALGWLIWTLAVWYRTVKFWDPEDVKEMNELLMKLHLRRK